MIGIPKVKYEYESHLFEFSGITMDSLLILALLCGLAAATYPPYTSGGYQNYRSYVPSTYSTFNTGYYPSYNTFSSRYFPSSSLYNTASYPTVVSHYLYFPGGNPWEPGRNYIDLRASPYPYYLRYYGLNRGGFGRGFGSGSLGGFPFGGFSTGSGSFPYGGFSTGSGYLPTGGLFTGSGSFPTGGFSTGLGGSFTNGLRGGSFPGGFNSGLLGGFPSTSGFGSRGYYDPSFSTFSGSLGAGNLGLTGTGGYFPGGNVGGYGYRSK